MIWMSNDTGTGQAETKEQKLSPSFLTIIMTRGQVFVTPRESLKKIPYQNALEFLAFGKDLIGNRLRLEFLE